MTAALLLLVAKLVDGVEVSGWGAAIAGALVLRLLNLCIAGPLGPP